KPEENHAKDRARAEAETRRRTAQQILARINGSSQRINENLSRGTTIEPPGPGGEAYANYTQVVKTYYDQAWIDPEEVSEDATTVKVKVVIARDGSVITDAILKRSRIPALDKSVENALNRVRQLPPCRQGHVALCKIHRRHAAFGGAHALRRHRGKNHRPQRHRAVEGRLYGRERTEE